MIQIMEAEQFLTHITRYKYLDPEHLDLLMSN